jgi:cation diffusion facilitator CzcD-associated flavoprotein CzcO
MAQTASQVTMLQRSPSYIIPQQREDALEVLIRRWSPAKWVHTLIRWKWLFIPWVFRQYCRYFPMSAKSFFGMVTKSMLPKGVAYSPDFEPKYFPWEQRMCFCPDADFFRAMKKGKASVMTGVIQEVTKDTIKLTDGRELHPDMIITATGLQMQLAGGMKICVDGQEHLVAGKHIWKNVMFEGVPNAAYMIGYVDASWTLGCDSAIQLIIRIIKKMNKEGKSVIEPIVPEGSNMKKLQYLNLTSTYVAKSKDVMPVAGDQPQWKGRMSYFRDIWEAWYGDIKTGAMYT